LLSYKTDPRLRPGVFLLSGMVIFKGWKFVKNIRADTGW
jgi:hypothetical protein